MMNRDRAFKIEDRKSKFLDAYDQLLAHGYDVEKRPIYDTSDYAYKCWQSCISHGKYLVKKGQQSWLASIGVNPEEIKIMAPKNKAHRQARKNVNYSHTSSRFYDSRAWKELRYEVLREGAGACCCCGARASDGLRIHVDHIKPRSKYPELQLNKSNLQILCEDCNYGKSNYYNDDWRVKMG